MYCTRGSDLPSTISVIGEVRGLLVIHVFDLHVFGYTRLRKIINIKKIVRFTTRNSVRDFGGHSSES